MSKFGIKKAGRRNWTSAAAGEPQAAGGGGADTPPSNTVSDNSTSDVPGFVVLRFGIDSLYLSFPGRLSSHKDEDLRQLKAAARSADVGEQAHAQLRVGDHIFEVRDKGSGLFAYVLEDGAYRIALASGEAHALPMAYVKVASHKLASTGPADVERELLAILGDLGEIGGVAYVSRIDLFADFVADLDMESWTRAAWVTRAGSVTAYAVKEGFSGWAIGLGGPIAARLYDKTLELKRSNKEWLKPLWSRRGWDGESRVLRLEFEVKRDALKTVELDTLDSVLPRLGDLWRYATTDWLRLTLENEADSTRSRWPTHPLWDRLSRIDWLGDPSPLSRTFKADRAPSIAWILRQMLALLFSFMAVRELDEFGPGMDQLLPELDALIGQRSELAMTEPTKYVRYQVALKARRFNTHFNLDDIPDEDRLRDEHDELLRHADEYRRKSRGY